MTENTGANVYKTVPRKLRKYVAQRYSLFHRYDEGIQLDDEAWYSVTPEVIAKRIAKRFSHLKVVIDLYSCVGGNTIQFAKAGMLVIAVEIDERKIEMAKHNAAIYGVAHRIQFIQGDVFEVLSAIRYAFDSSWGIFMSPPWGGPEYLEQTEFDVSVFKRAVHKARKVSRNVAILVPRNVSDRNVFEHLGHCEIQENRLRKKVKTKTLYFGALAFSGTRFQYVATTRTARDENGMALDEVVVTRAVRGNRDVAQGEVTTRRGTQEDTKVETKGVSSTRLFGIERKWVYGLLAMGLACGGLFWLCIHHNNNHTERKLSLPKWFHRAWKQVERSSTRRR